jgi:hypothetical protein
MAIYTEIFLLEKEVASPLYSGMQFAAVPRQGDYVDVEDAHFVVCFITHTPSPYGAGPKVRVTVKRN